MADGNIITDTRERLINDLRERVLVIDGAMGTMIQQTGLSEGDFRGRRFKNKRGRLSGCNDLLCVTRPDIITGIHRAYMEAGADIIETTADGACTGVFYWAPECFQTRDFEGNMHGYALGAFRNARPTQIMRSFTRASRLMSGK